MHEHPTWFYGPSGQSKIFHKGETVPAGWHDHPSKVITAEKTGSKPMPPETDQISAAQRGSAPVHAKNDATGEATGGKPAKKETTDVSNTLDAAGWPFDSALHAATQTKTKDGLWRMKVGVSRPEPKAGFPKPALDL
jgi:hypothetical protein